MFYTMQDLNLLCSSVFPELIGRSAELWPHIMTSKQMLQTSDVKIRLRLNLS